MKIFKKIGEWLVAAFAAVMRTMFPTLAIKYFTKYRDGSSCIIIFGEDERKERAMLYLPSVKRQLEAIKKLNLSDKEIRARVWSRETMKALFRQGNSSMIFLLKGSDEDIFDIIVAGGNSKMTSEAMAKATPKGYYLRNFLKTAPNAVTVFKMAPQAFNSLEYNDIPEERRKEFLGTILLPGMEEKKGVIEWAKKVYSALLLLDDSEISEDEKNLLISAVALLVKSTNLADGFWPLFLRHPEAYAKMVQAVKMKGVTKASYLAKALPEVRKEKSLFSREEAEFWLELACREVGDSDVQGVIFKTLSEELSKDTPKEPYRELQERLAITVQRWFAVRQAVKVLPKRYHWSSYRLEDRLVKSICSPACAEEAIALLRESANGASAELALFEKKALRQLIDMTTGENAKTLLAYFPFADWADELAIPAVRRLANVHALPMDRLSELSEPLQETAVVELETQAQIRCLYSGGDRAREMLMKRLHPGAEIYLFTENEWFYRNRKQVEEPVEERINHPLPEGGVMEEIRHYTRKVELPSFVESYLRRNKIAESSFRTLCRDAADNRNRISISNVADMIQIYAEAQGLTRQNYLDLLDSPRANLAPTLKKYVESEEADADVVVDEDEDGEVRLIGGGSLDEGDVVVNCDKDEA